MKLYCEIILRRLGYVEGDVMGVILFGETGKGGVICPQFDKNTIL